MERASFSHHGLLYGWSSRSSVETLEGRKLPRDIDVIRLIVDNLSSPPVGIPIIAGRNFTGLEQKSDLRQVLISREFARTGFNLKRRSAASSSSARNRTRRDTRSSASSVMHGSFA